MKETRDQLSFKISQRKSHEWKCKCLIALLSSTVYCKILPLLIVFIREALNVTEIGRALHSYDFSVPSFCSLWDKGPAGPFLTV